MRIALRDALAKLALERSDIALVTSDLGSFTQFRDVAPDRFFNVGVAEPLSISFAAGLASEGFKVFVFSVAGFTLYRAWEQLKFAVGFWQQDVTLIGTGFGWRYYMIGRGHRTPDDLALMRLIPNMQILAPATEGSLRTMLTENTTGPRFIRIGEGLQPGTLPPTSGASIVAALGETWVRLIEPVHKARAAGHNVGLVPVEELEGDHVQTLAASGRPLLVVEDHIAFGGLGDCLRCLGGNVVAHHHLPNDVGFVKATEDDLLAAYRFREIDLTEWLLKQLSSHRPTSSGG